jgi:serine/threonine protein kinase
MLTGRLPFASESARESLIMRLTDTPMSLRRVSPTIEWPDAVQTVIGKALARDPARRYQSASEFGRAFYEAVSRMPDKAAARPFGSESRIVPPTRIHRYSGETVVQEDRYVSTVGLLATLVVILTIATVIANRESAFPSAAPMVAKADTHATTKAIARDTTDVFARLDSMANDSTTASAAVASLATVPLASAEDSVRAALVRFAAALSLRDKKACDALREVRTIAPRTTKATLVAGKLTDLCSN